MTRLIGTIAFSSVLAVTSLAWGQSQPTPRPPLAPGDSFRQFPEALQTPAIDTNSVAITNFGNVTLRFSAWDGVSSWKQYQVAAGQTLTISCRPCGTAIPISFHDGSQNRTTNLKTANSYGLYWDSSQQRWDLAPAAIAQRGGQAR